MNKKIMMFLFMLFSNVAQKITAHRGSYREIANIKLKLLCLKTVKTCRLLFISYFLMRLGLVLSFSSLVLFHVTFFVYAPFSAETKMWAGFVFALAYFLIAAKAFSYVFAEEKWVNAFYARNLFEESDDAPFSQKVNPN